MKKFIVLFILLFLTLPVLVKADSVGISCSSNNVKIGEMFTCSIYAYSNEVSGMEADVIISSNFTVVDAVNKINGSVNSSKIIAYGPATSSSLEIATYTLKATSAVSNGYFKLTNATLVDSSYNVVSVPDTLTNINVSEAVVIPTTPAVPTVIKPFLSSLSIEELNFDFSPTTYSYNLVIPYVVKKLNISYLATPSTSKINVNGSTEMKVGNNKIEITVSDLNGSNTYILNLIREDNVINLKYEESDNLISSLGSDSDKKIIVKIDDLNNIKVSKDILKLIKDNKKNVTYEIYDNNEFLYSINFKGEEISSFNRDFDLNIYDFNNTYGDYKYILGIKNNNTFKGTVTYLLNLSNKFNDEVYIYRLNNNKYEYIKILDKDKYVTLKTNKFDNYIIVNNKINNIFKNILQTIEIIVIAIILVILSFLIVKRRKEK